MINGIKILLISNLIEIKAEVKTSASLLSLFFNYQLIGNPDVAEPDVADLQSVTTPHNKSPHKNDKYI